MTRWLPVPGHKPYEVSDDGRVRRNGRILKMRSHPSGHLFVSLSKYPYRKEASVARLVLLAFIGPPPKGTESRHYPDRDPTNNRLSNLSWATRRTNVLDRIEHGTDNAGERHGMSVLTWRAVRAIRAEKTKTNKEIAMRLEIHPSTVSLVRRGKRWKEQNV
jgi:NUMOD4 motif/HNH endonuclease